MPSEERGGYACPGRGCGVSVREESLVMRRMSRVAGILWAVMVTVAAASSEVVEWTLAVVENEAVTYSEWRTAWNEAVSAFTQFRTMELPVPTPLRVLDHLVGGEVLSLEAKRRRIDVNEEEVNERLERFKKMNNLTEEMFRRALREQGMKLEDLKERLRVQIRNEKLQQLEIVPRVSRPKEEDLRAYYERNKERMMTPERRRVAHILFLPLREDAPLAEQVKFKRTLEQALKEAKASKDFSKVAAKYSQDEATKEKGGDLGWIERGRMLPEFEEEVFRMRPGEVRGPFPSRMGWHIVKLTEVRPSTPLPFEEAKNDIRAVMLEEMFQKEFENWIRERKGSYGIRVVLKDGRSFVLGPDGWKDPSGRKVSEDELDGLLALELGVRLPRIPPPSRTVPQGGERSRGRR